MIIRAGWIQFLGLWGLTCENACPWRGAATLECKCCEESIHEALFLSLVHGWVDFVLRFDPCSEN